MSTSNKAATFEAMDTAAPARKIPGPVSHATLAREAGIVAVLVAGLTALCLPGDLGAGLHPHPAWAVVIFLAARYGTRGFAFAVTGVWGALTLTALGMGLGAGPLVTMRDSAADLAALVLSVLVAWIASTHESRIRDLAAGMTNLLHRKTNDAATVVALRDAAVALRTRADRLDHSVTFTRDVATRLESGDPLLAYQAALDLAMARTGARAGIVQLVQRHRLRTFASLGPWTLQSATPPDLFADATIRAAFDEAKPVLGRDLVDAGRDDSDVAVPITDDAGGLLGVLALRGVPSDSLCRALVHDLALIARWGGKASVPMQVPAQAPDVAIAAAPDSAGTSQLPAPFAWDAPTTPAMQFN